MRRICWWLVDILCKTLEGDECDAVRGDLAESGESGGQALREVLGLVVRRQADLWKDWRPWLALAGLVVPLAVLLSLVCRRTASSSAVYIWMYANNWDWAFFGNAGFRHDLAHYIVVMLLEFVTLACLSWAIGFVLGSVSRRTILVNAFLFCLVLLFGNLLDVPRYVGHSMLPPRGGHDNDAVFGLAFYRVVFPLIVQALLGMVPFLWGMRPGRRLASLRPLRHTVVTGLTLLAIAIQGWLRWRFPNYYFRASTWDGAQLLLLQPVIYGPIVYMLVSAIARGRLRRVPALLLMLAGIAAAADPATVTATLQPASERKAATEFALKDSSGKTITLKKYRGRVVLLDFWATWCHGCIQEMPWFAEFHRKYDGKGLTVVGVSLDEDGWKVVKPFVESAKVPYRIILGNEATARKYGIESMPDTYLIDRKGRIGATYVGLVDRDNVEANIRTMLGQK